MFRASAQAEKKKEGSVGKERSTYKNTVLTRTRYLQEHGTKKDHEVVDAGVRPVEPPHHDPIPLAANHRVPNASDFSKVDVDQALFGGEY
jgi:hypothetical protein